MTLEEIVRSIQSIRDDAERAAQQQRPPGSLQRELVELNYQVTQHRILLFVQRTLGHSYLYFFAIFSFLQLIGSS